MFGTFIFSFVLDYLVNIFSSECDTFENSIFFLSPALESSFFFCRPDPQENLSDFVGTGTGQALAHASL